MPFLFILQGPSGGGKSTVAKGLEKGFDALVCSTDDYFVNCQTGEYKYIPEKLGQYHLANQTEARKAMSKGLNVVIDNTNIRNWEARPYVEAGIEFGYDIRFIRCDSFYENTHGVPAEKVRQMRDAMEHLTIEGALSSAPPWVKPKPLERGQVVQLVGKPFDRHAIVCPENANGCILVMNTLGGWLASVGRKEIHRVLDETFEVPADLIEAYKDWGGRPALACETNGQLAG